MKNGCQRSYKDTSSFLLNKNRNKFVPFQKCFFHATAKREILPLIGVAVLAVVGRYSYRAVRRMQEEWEEYEEDLKEYNATTNNLSSDTSRTRREYTDQSKKSTTLPILGISIGPSYTRVSFLNTTATAAAAGDANTPLVVENREGSRRTPSFVLFDNDGSNNYLWGQMAKSTRFKNRERIISPISELLSLAADHNNLNNKHNVSARVAQAQNSCLIMTREVALNALQKILGESNTKVQQILFGETYYNVQPVVTYPPSFDFSNSMAKILFMDSIKSLAATDGTIQYISEPIAAIIAAKHFRLFPHTSNNDQPILVLDVGSDGLNISLVAAQQQKVLFHSFASDIGVDTLIRAIVDLCTRDFFTSYDAVDEVALQLLYNAAEGALSELSSSNNARNTRAQISIPYISMDFQTRKPLHLNMGITPHLVEQEATRIILTTNRTITGSSTTKMSDVLYYILLNFLEQAKMTPYELSGVLLCGDGARSTIYQSCVKAALAAIAGDYFVSTKLIIPPNEAAEELVVIGSALAGRETRGE